MPLARIADLNGDPDEVARYIEQAKELSDMYDDFIVLTQDGHERAPGIHASELYPCLRRPVYSVRGTPKHPNVSKFWKQRFKVGTAIHLMMQSDFEAMARRSIEDKAMRVAGARAEKMDCYFEFEREVPIHPDIQPIAAHYNLHSACDGVFTFKKKDTHEVVLRIGLEIKTESPDEYGKLKGPKSSHLRQAHLYMGVLDLPLMWFFYMNKGNQNNTNSQSPYLVVWNPQLWAELEGRFKVILEHAAGEGLPERNEGIWCEFCPWSYTCEPKNPGAIRHRPTTRRETIRTPGA